MEIRHWLLICSRVECIAGKASSPSIEESQRSKRNMYICCPRDRKSRTRLIELGSYPRVPKAWAGDICDNLLQMFIPQGVQSQGKRTKSGGQEFHGCFQREMPYAYGVDISVLKAWSQIHYQLEDRGLLFHAEGSSCYDQGSKWHQAVTHQPERHCVRSGGWPLIRWP